jgi:hypothetical protein
MVEEADAGRHVVDSGAVEIELDGDFVSLVLRVIWALRMSKPL